MLEGIGVQTIGGIVAVLIAGEVTPLDCYVGVGASVGNGFHTEQPIGALGCEYNVNGSIRLFGEHLSSPADPSDYPGMNHAGVKILFPTDPVTFYTGASIELGSDLVSMDNPLVIAGVETNGDIRFYVEHVNSISNPGEGITHGGIKFIF